MTKLLFLVALIPLLILFHLPYAVAQQEDNKTIINNVEVPPSSVDQNAIDYYEKEINVAQLHNASVNTINTLIAQYDVYKCLNALVNSEDMLSSCNNHITDLIVNHELGNNQTIINLAHTFLKARGIQ
jgi:hypothetical protein